MGYTLEMSNLAVRLSAIVDAAFGGNAVAAAHAASLPASTVHRVVEGKVTAPRLTTLEALAEAYGLPLSWLVGEVSAREAQHGAEVVLPEALWIVRQTFRRRQRDDRRWLDRVETSHAYSDNPEIRKIVADFSDFRLLPDGTGTALDVQLLPVIAEAEPVGEQEIIAYRALAEAETRVLALAVKRLKKLGVRPPEEKIQKNRR